MTEGLYAQNLDSPSRIAYPQSADWLIEIRVGQGYEAGKCRGRLTHRTQWGPEREAFRDEALDTTECAGDRGDGSSVLGTSAYDSCPCQGIIFDSLFW